jgi:hypothetical protein
MFGRRQPGMGTVKRSLTDEVIRMWADIGIAAFLLFGVYACVQLIRTQTRLQIRRSNRRAEDLYPQFADTPRQQRKYAREHGGTWTDEPATHRDPASH